MNETSIKNKKMKLTQILHRPITLEDFKNIGNKILNNFLWVYIIANILYILVGSYLCNAGTMHLLAFSIGEILLMLLNVVSIIILLIKGKYKKSPIHLCILAILVFSVISTIFARIYKVAILGFDNRYEGLLVICYYLSLTFLTTLLDKKYKKIIANCIVITGLIQSIYGICQTYNFPFVHNQMKGIAQGFVTNPNFYGTYMILCLSYALGLYIDETKKIKNIIYIIFSVILTVGVLISNAMSSVVGLMAVLLYILIYCIKKKKILKIIATIIIVIVSVIITTNLGKTNVIKDVQTTSQEAMQVAKGNAQNSFGSGRMYIWKETLKIVPKYFWFGAGIDNLYYAFGVEPLKMENIDIAVDKAHNEYLQILVTEGIFTLISYIMLYFVVLKNGIKQSFKDDKIYLILPIIGYLIQAFFNISVIEVAPIFYIALGLADK